MPNSKPSRNAKYLHNAQVCCASSPQIHPLNSTKTLNLRSYGELAARYDRNLKFTALAGTAFRHVAHTLQDGLTARQRRINPRKSLCALLLGAGPTEVSYYLHGPAGGHQGAAFLMFVRKPPPA